MRLPIRSLSGGNQQKVAIAAAIVKRPEVLVLEEPTRGVDIGSQGGDLPAHARPTRRRHTRSCIYCTEVPEVFEAADRVYVVSEGRTGDALTVAGYPDVKALAAAITRRERHVATPAA